MTNPVSSVPKRKILCFIDTVGLGGGAEQLLVTLLPKLKARGLQLELVALYPWDPDIGYILENENIRVHRWNLKGPWDLVTGICCLIKLLWRGGFDRTWGHLYGGNLYASLAQILSFGRIKAIATLHSPGHPSTRKYRPTVLMERWIVGRALKKVAVSDTIQDEYAKFFSWSSVERIYNGVEIPLEAKLTIPKKDAEHANEFLIVVPSRFTPNKGQDILLEALALLEREKNFKPVVMNPGVGPSLDYLRSQARNLGLQDRVHFIPSLPHLELLHLVKSADLVVIPSKREPFGIAAVEAALLETCVILSSVDGLAEIAGSPPAFPTFSSGDIRGLANLIWDLSQNEKSRKDWAKRSQIRAQKNYSLDLCAEKWHRSLDALGMCVVE